MNDTTRQEIICLYTNGSSIKEIMNDSGYGKSTIWSIVRGLRRQDKFKLTDMDQKYIIDHYTRNYDTKLLATQFNVSRGLIYKILQKAKVTRPPTEANRIYHTDIRYFNSLNIEKAYWLGFILADGCITDRHQLCLTISKKDFNHLKLFRDSITESPIHFSNKTIGKKTYELCSLAISSKELCDDLRSLGVHERKSLVHGTPGLSSDLYSSFYLGYFDGDGSIYKPKNRRGHTYITSILGSEAFCKQLQNWIGSECDATYHINNYKRISELRGATESSFRLLTKLYSESSVYLDRKFNLYIQMIEDHCSNRSRTRPKLGNVWDVALKIKQQENGLLQP
jgi:transposase